MRTSLLLTAALATLGVQADDTSSLIIGYFSPPWDAGLLEYGGWTSTAASLVAYNTKAATYHVGCVDGAPKTDCNYPASWTIIQGPETTSSYDITVTQSYECSLKSSTESASCTMSAGMSGSLDGGKYESSTSSKATYTTAPISNSYYQLTVTAGLSSISTAEATTTSGTTVETTSTSTSTGGAAAGPVGALITAAPMVAAAMAALL
ncbi:unnamed protein product [Penicillium glandicola]